LNKTRIDQTLDIVQQIKERGHRALKPFYQELKPLFLGHMTRYTQDPDIRLDAFHEAVIAFYEYCLAGKYDPAKSAPKTLIFMMGRAYLINRLKVEKRQVPQETEVMDRQIANTVIKQYQFSLNDEEIIIREAILSMGKKCQELLHLFYYENYKIEVIKERMQYKNENVVSSHKSRCIKQLKEIIQKKQ
jgi:RNA polymerase sigma-70 factor (ECF subfamily)